MMIKVEIMLLAFSSGLANIELKYPEINLEP